MGSDKNTEWGDYAAAEGKDAATEVSQPVATEPAKAPETTATTPQTV